MKIRAFLALPLAEGLRKDLHALAAGIARADVHAEVRWIPPENYHVSLHFLGDILHADLGRLQQALAGALADFAPVRLQFSEISYFPFNRHPRLVLALLMPGPELMELQRRSGSVIRQLGLPLEARRYVPHVTLGRLRGRRMPRLDIAPTPLQLEQEVSRCVLYRSELDRSGARYHEQFSVYLAG